MARSEFSKTTKRAALARAMNRCEASGFLYGLPATAACGVNLAHGVEFDHVLADSNGGDASLGNCLAVCVKCHKYKTAKHDTPRAAKGLRQQDKARGIKHKHNWGKRPMTRARYDNTRDVAMLATKVGNVAAAAEAALKELVAVTHWGDSSFINLPLVYPSGAFVTVKLEYTGKDFKISDNGFAYRETESLGTQRSFSNTAASIAMDEDLEVSKRAIYVHADEGQLVRAICDVAKASWIVADKIVGRASEEAAIEISDHLQQKLVTVFGVQHVDVDSPKIIGASTTEWELSAIVKLNERRVAFQAVANHANSIFRASTEFSDISQTEAPPTLVAVVKQKSAHPDITSRLASAFAAGKREGFEEAAKVCEAVADGTYYTDKIFSDDLMAATEGCAEMFCAAAIRALSSTPPVEAARYDARGMRVMTAADAEVINAVLWRKRHRPVARD